MVSTDKMYRYLVPTAMIDSDHPDIIKKAEELTTGLTDDIDKSMRFFYFARDVIQYNLYEPRSRPEHFRASSTLARGKGYCVSKAVVLAALCRAVGIPARLGFATIRLHIVPVKLTEIFRTHDLPDHGFAELLLGGKWIKATPSFDIEMCRQYSFIPIEFDGKKDAKYHPYTMDGRQHIEYISFKDHYDDVPIERIAEWIEPFLTSEGKRLLLSI